MDNFIHLWRELQDLQNRQMFRQCRTVDSAQGPTVQIDGRELVCFCSNDYLNLANHPKIIAAAHEALEKYGWGAASSRLISGTMTPHTEAEKQWAAFFQKPAGLFFNSGWIANQSVLTTLPGKGDVVLIDRMNHASIIDAVKQSDAEFHTYRRDNLDRLEKYLSSNKYRHKYIVTESVFSMDGDCADLKTLVGLKNKYNAVLIVDEAHAVGCLGQTGTGLSEGQGVLGEIDIIIAPLGKGPACGGAIVASDKIVIDYLVNKARPFIFTTAASPVNAAVSLAALEIIQNEPQRRETLKSNADYLRKQFAALKLNTGQSASHIIPIILGSAEKTIQIAKTLYENGIFVSAIRPPTIPAGTERLRISLQAGHTKKHLDYLTQVISG